MKLKMVLLIADSKVYQQKIIWSERRMAQRLAVRSFPLLGFVRTFW